MAKVKSQPAPTEQAPRRSKREENDRLINQSLSSDDDYPGMMEQPESSQSNTGSCCQRLRNASKLLRTCATRCSEWWTSSLLLIRKPLTFVLLKVSSLAAYNPKTCITTVVLLSLAMVTIGLFTNFRLDVDEDVLWTPMGSRSLEHGRWVAEESGFPLSERFFTTFIHANGADVLGEEGMERVFAVQDAVRDLDGYVELCKQSTGREFYDENGDLTCLISGATQFWNYSLSDFREDNMVAEESMSQQDGVESIADENVILTLSQTEYPNGAPVDRNAIYGKHATDSENILTVLEAHILVILLPRIEESFDFEEKAIEAVRKLDKSWEAETGNPWRVEVAASRSFSDEFTRSIVKDIPLVPLVFVLMSAFTCFIFFRRDWVFSRSMLGFGAVVSVLLAIMFGYGLLFIIGIPVTSMTQLLPFIMFGIGLDDAFIISGAYFRTDKSKTAEDRIHDTIEEAGMSILVTTITSGFAFGLGCSSSIPAVYWLCLYAFPTIITVFIYTITFFVALIVIDERRLKDKRRDWLFWSTVKSRIAADEPEPEETVFDRFMAWYAEKLMNNWVKVFVICAFTLLFWACAYSASQLTQAFEFTDVVPSDSYLIDYNNVAREHTTYSGAEPYLYFRFVDQSDPEIQDQMEQFVNDYVALDEVSGQPPFFWLRHFRNFTEIPQIQEFPFDVQMDIFLEQPIFYALYNNDIVRNIYGEVVASRTLLKMNNVDSENVVAEVAALANQREVSAMQEINQGRDDWAFFGFSGSFYFWEFYAVAPTELVSATIFGVISVTVIGALFIPHWTSPFFIFPIISVLYIDLLGVLQFAGVPINAVSYISLVMSIGLLVDYLMHVLLRYYESTETTREGKVKDMLRTMGTSILVGGISTFLGTMPLILSASDIFYIVFVTFLGLVTLGIGHGLILVPVLLSILGPRNVVIPVGLGNSHVQEAEKNPDVKTKGLSAQSANAGIAYSQSPTASILKSFGQPTNGFEMDFHQHKVNIFEEYETEFQRTRSNRVVSLGDHIAGFEVQEEFEVQFPPTNHFMDATTQDESFADEYIPSREVQNDSSRRSPRRSARSQRNRGF